MPACLIGQRAYVLIGQRCQCARQVNLLPRQMATTVIATGQRVREFHWSPSSATSDRNGSACCTERPKHLPTKTASSTPYLDHEARNGAMEARPLVPVRIISFLHHLHHAPPPHKKKTHQDHKFAGRSRARKQQGCCIREVIL